MFCDFKWTIWFVIAPSLSDFKQTATCVVCTLWRSGRASCTAARGGGILTHHSDSRVNPGAPFVGEFHRDKQQKREEIKVPNAT